MTNLMFLLLYCIGFAVLFAIVCGIEWAWFHWHERRRYCPSVRNWHP